MFPINSGIIRTHKSAEKINKEILDMFKDGRLLRLINEYELKEGKFRLYKRNNVFKIFERKTLLGEIKGQITDNEIHYTVEMSNMMKFFCFIYLIIFVGLSVMFFSNDEYETGVALLGIIIVSTIITYFMLYTEISYLKNLFEEKMKYI